MKKLQLPFDCYGVSHLFLMSGTFFVKEDVTAYVTGTLLPYPRRVREGIDTLIREVARFKVE